ncbi:Pyridoxal-dependent decarboxylase (plasmid) [Gemmatirosa kalamazoonensis]|uniref:Pyridoxal-dependent decarboxylase n=1 Tax=Gemmatirosa kalamazoonensis TaxID=861299 RepID=W0RQF4_9BACT|nr:pyridoxal-dependent decarboxylase [Gemmatirosa kalamazoonensis]AHG92682.1 Pyridoxal-dependent decarboxylase [Gemmatirosa kalamazoonensis]
MQPSGPTHTRARPHDAATASAPLAPVTDLAWDADRARALGAEVVALWAELLERLPAMPVAGRASVADVRAAVVRAVPEEPLAPEELVAALRTIALEHATYTGHPGFMAYITGAGTVPGAAADLIAAVLNQNVGAWRLAPAATEIELHLGRWFASRLGLPSTAGGYVTSGGAMAAFIGLKAARDARAGWRIRELGTRGGPPLTLYASSQAHDVNTRAADMLGLGREAVRVVPCDGELRMRVDALRACVARDVRNGYQPVAVVATAGTVSTGAIDPLDAIADVCAEHRLWMHVDGAYGGAAALTDALRPRFRGIERADSVAFDPHKWLYTPHSGGVIVVRDMQTLADAFSMEPSYVYEDKELTGRGVDLYGLGPQFSRGFQALKIWMSLLAHGWSAYERRIAHDVALARRLHDRVVASPVLEPVGPPPTLSIACFRYVPRELRDRRGEAQAEDYLNRLNARLMTELQLGGRVFPSNAVIDGRFALRACIVNFRTEAADIDALVDQAVATGEALHRTERASLGTA